MGQRFSTWQEKRTRENYVEDGWGTSSKDYDLKLPGAHPKRRPRRESEKISDDMYKKKIRARSADYYAGAWHEEKSSAAPTEVVAGQGKRPIMYKTVPRWTQAILAEKRETFWENAEKEKESPRNAGVWMILKRYLKKLAECDEATFSDNEAPVIEKGSTIDSIQGVVAHSGVWRKSQETGSMLYYYVFSDADSETYEIPCYVIAPPRNLL